MDSNLSQELMAALRESSTLNNQLHSPLLRLPAELRNQIYRLVFANTTIRLLPKETVSNKPICAGCNLCNQLRKLRGVSLLLACRQIYTEANDFLMANATFDVREIGIDGFVEEYGRQKAAQVTSLVCRHRQIWLGRWPSQRDLEALRASDHPIKALVALRRLCSISGFVYRLTDGQDKRMREILDCVTGDRLSAGTLEYTTIHAVDR